MKCLLKYRWVKLPRAVLPNKRGIMGYWLKLASRAAYRCGKAKYCGYINDIEVGTWSGGVVGIKSILGVRSRQKALDILDQLQRLDYISYSLDPKTKKLTYRITNWIMECSGAPSTKMGSVYATADYGFMCIPRNIMDRLVNREYKFEEADAWLDLWCHTVHNDPQNAFSFAPIVQYGKYDIALTLETLGRRWGWEKTKVWRFLKKSDVFTLKKLPGSYGCLIYNNYYPTMRKCEVPNCEEVKRILDEIRFLGKKTYLQGTDNYKVNRLLSWYSKKIQVKSEKISSSSVIQIQENRVAFFCPIIRAYFSLCRNCRNCRNCNNDCKGSICSTTLRKAKYTLGEIRGG